MTCGLTAVTIVLGAAHAAALISYVAEHAWPAGGLLVANAAAASGAALALGVTPVAGAAACATSGTVAVLLSDGDARAATIESLPGAGLTTAVAVVVVLVVGRGLAATQRELGALDEALVAADVESRRRAADRELDRRLHDTVLSTLSLLAQPVPGLPADPVRQRCRADRDVLLMPAAPAATVAVEEHKPRDADGGPFAAQLDVPGIDVHVHGAAATQLGRLLSPPRAAAVTAAVREAVENARRHSGAPQVDVIVLRDVEDLLVQVVDDGCGFDPDTVPAERLGLRESIIGRTRDVGGRAEITSRRGAGTSVTIRVPASTDGGPAS